MYDKAIGDLVCEALASGRSLRSVCEDDGMPSKTTVMRWLLDDEAFRDQYAQARELQAEAIFDEIIDIADDGSNDWMERKNADGENIGWQENGEALRRSVLRVEARKWMAGKLKPKKYGEKLDLNHSGRVDLVPTLIFEGMPGTAPNATGE